MRIRIAAVAVALCVQSAASWAQMGLLDIYQQALVHDADFAAARAARRAGAEAAPQGLSWLLPSVNFSASKMRNDYQNGINRPRDYDYSTETRRVQLVQPLFNLERYARYRQGQARFDYSEAQFINANQEFTLKVAEQYFNYLLAQDSLVLVRAQKQAIGEQKKQAEQMFKGGVGTITDIQEAQARYDLVVADELAAVNTLEVKQRELKKLIGEIPKDLRSLSEQLPLESPKPIDMEFWIDAARQANPRVKQQKANTEYAQHDVTRARSDFFPSVDLVLSRQRVNEPNYYTDREITRSSGIQLNIPLFEGGRTLSATREALANRDKAQQELESVQRDAELKASQAYLDVMNGIAKIRALEQAVKSSETSLKGTKIGLDVGLRTSVDVLNAQQQFFQARRDLLKARYSYVLARLSLLAAAGTLGEDAILEVDRWLNRSAIA